MSANFRAMGAMLIGMATFAATDSTIKFASQTLPIGQVMAILGTIAAVFTLIICMRRGESVFSPIFFDRFVILRNSAEVIGTAGLMLALATSPISTVSAIQQAMPLMVTLLAVLFLKEPVGWRRWSAIFVGLLGVLIIIRPSASGIGTSALFALVGAIGLSVRDLGSRLAPKNASTPLLSFYAFFVLIPCGIIWALLDGGFKPVTGPLLCILLFGGVTAVLGYLGATYAMRNGEVAIVSPIRYSRLLFAAAIGWIVFGEIPDQPTIIGGMLVIAAGLYAMWRETRLNSDNT